MTILRFTSVFSARKNIEIDSPIPIDMDRKTGSFKCRQYTILFLFLFICNLILYHIRIHTNTLTFSSQSQCYYQSYLTKKNYSDSIEWIFVVVIVICPFTHL